MRMVHFLQVKATNPEICTKIVTAYGAIAVIAAISGCSTWSAESPDSRSSFQLGAMVAIFLIGIIAYAHEENLRAEHISSHTTPLPPEEAVDAAEIAMEIIKEHPDAEALYFASQPTELAKYGLSPEQVAVVRQLTGNEYNRIINGTSRPN